MQKRITVFFDNRCPICISVKKMSSSFDWLHQIDFVGIRGNKDLPFPIHQMEKEMYAFNLKKKEYFVGINALYQLSLSLPLLWPLVPFIKLSIIPGLGDKLYKAIASRRSIVPVGHCTNEKCNL